MPYCGCLSSVLLGLELLLLLDGWLVRRHDGPEYSVFFVLVRQPIPQACHF
jgi:hypothetical protein